MRFSSVLFVFFVLMAVSATATWALVFLFGPMKSTSARTEAFRERCLTVGFTVEQCEFFKDGAGK